MAYGAVTVTDTATEIIGPGVQRRSHMLFNRDAANTVYIGPDTSITTANAYPLGPLNQLLEDKAQAGYWKGPVYGICTAGNTAEVRYWTRIEST